MEHVRNLFPRHVSVNSPLPKIVPLGLKKSRGINFRPKSFFPPCCVPYLSLRPQLPPLPSHPSFLPATMSRWLSQPNPTLNQWPCSVPTCSCSEYVRIFIFWLFYSLPVYWKWIPFCLSSAPPGCLCSTHFQLTGINALPLVAFSSGINATPIFTATPGWVNAMTTYLIFCLFSNRIATNHHC